MDTFFTCNGMFLMYPKMFYLRTVNSENQNVEYVLKRVSVGSKDCTKELKLECAYFLGQNSLFLPFRLY